MSCPTQERSSSKQTKFSCLSTNSFAESLVSRPFCHPKREFDIIFRLVFCWSYPCSLGGFVREIERTTDFPCLYPTAKDRPMGFFPKRTLTGFLRAPISQQIQKGDLQQKDTPLWMGEVGNQNSRVQEFAHPPCAMRGQHQGPPLRIWRVTIMSEKRNSGGVPNVKLGSTLDFVGIWVVPHDLPQTTVACQENQVPQILGFVLLGSNVISSNQSGGGYVVRSCTRTRVQSHPIQTQTVSRERAIKK